MPDRSALVRSARLAIRLALILNGCFFLAIAIGFICSLVGADRFTALLLQPVNPSAIGAQTAGVRWLMIVGLLGSVATQVILHHLGKMAAALSSGDPFVAENAARLRRIGWALLALQLLDFPMMAIHSSFPELGDAVPDTGISLTGWLSVLLVFVLARIFAAGTSMRDYLEETI